MLRPDSAKARNSLGVSLASRGKIAEAAGHFREALRLDPGNVQARANLEDALRGWR
jgi:Flp pilus assembly protein TadD